MNDLRWFHSIDLGNGEVTKGKKNPDLLRSEADIIFKHGVAGKSVLDIGAWDGYFSFSAEERGASRVLATDSYCWIGPGWGRKTSFDYAHAQRSSKVESEILDVSALDPERLGKFDTVLFLGVLYHLPEPLTGLMKAAAMTKETLVVETHIDLLTLDLPAMRFYPGDALNRDTSNFFAPNPPCLIAMLKEIGFSKVELTAHPHWPELFTPPPPPKRPWYSFLKRQEPAPVRETGRVIAHATW